MRPLTVHCVGDSQSHGTGGQGGLREGIASVLACMGVNAWFRGVNAISSTESAQAYDCFGAHSGERGLGYSSYGGSTTPNILQGTGPATASLATNLAAVGPADVVMASIGSNDSASAALTDEAARLIEVVKAHNSSCKLCIVGPGTSVASTWAFAQADSARVSISKYIEDAVDGAGPNVSFVSIYDMYWQMYLDTAYGNSTDTIAISGFYDTAHFMRAVYMYVGAKVASEVTGVPFPDVLSMVKGRGAFADRHKGFSATGIGAATTTMFSPSDFRPYLTSFSAYNAHATNSVTVTLEYEVVTQAGAALGTPIRRTIAERVLAAGASWDFCPGLVQLPFQSQVRAVTAGTTPNVRLYATMTEKFPIAL